MPIVIIEGPDLSGKSTAIDILSKKLNSGFVLKNSYKPKERNSLIYYQYESIIAGVMTYLDRQPDELIIFDRFYSSEAVYSILRNYDEMESPEIAAIEDMLLSLKTKFILIDTPIEELERRYKIRGDENVKITQLLELKKRYDIFYDQCLLDKIRLDTTKEGWEQEAIEFITGESYEHN